MHRMLSRRFESDGVSLNVLVAGGSDAVERPLCVLLHGWPELGLSWRHQVPFLVERGYEVAVPDLRGYGLSDAPTQVEAYCMRAMVGDVVAIIDALGYADALVIGHDWGAPVAWHTALLAPERVSAVVGMSVPHLGRGGPAPPTQLFRSIYGERFFYILYFQEKGVPEAEFEADVRHALSTIYYVNSADVSQEARQAMRKRRSGYLEGLAAPDPFPAWLPAGDLDQYVAAYERSGFHGGINRYRNMDHDWHDLEELAERRIDQPALFIAGEYDSVLRYGQGIDLMAAMDSFYSDLRGKVIVPGAGHWVQQEQSDRVNNALGDFIDGLR